MVIVKYVANHSSKSLPAQAQHTYALKTYNDGRLGHDGHASDRRQAIAIHRRSVRMNCLQLALRSVLVAIHRLTSILDLAAV